MKKNEDTIVVTFPIGVRSSKVKNGLLLTPLVSQIIAKNMDADFMLVLNSMDSYIAGREEYVEPFMQACSDMNISPDIVYVDDQHKDELTKYVNELLDLGIVKPEHRKIKLCDCGKVQLLENAPTQPEARLYHINNVGEEICSSCNTKLKSVERDVLVYHAPKNLGIPPISYPQNSVPRVKNLWDTISGMEYLFSRERETGIKISRDDKIYNVDVDSCWLQYLSAIKHKNIIMVGSNHVVWHLCMAASYLKAKNDNRNIQMVFTPYIRGDEPDNSKSFISMRKALWFASHITWQRLETKWNPSVSNILQKTPDESIIKSYLDLMKEDLCNKDVRKSLQNMSSNNILNLIKKNKQKGGRFD